MTQKKHKLDIFQVLGQISKRNRNFYSSLSEEEQKALMPLVVMRWMSGTSDARQLFFLNELVNPLVFSLYDHKELLVHLMSICGPGKTKRYFWNKAKSKKKTSTPTCVNVIRDYFGYNTLDAIEALPLLSDIDVLTYATHLGRQKEDVAKIKKELKGRNG